MIAPQYDPILGREVVPHDLQGGDDPPSDHFCWLAPECYEEVMQLLEVRRFSLKQRIADGKNCEKNQRADVRELAVIQKAIQELTH